MRGRGHLRTDDDGGYRFWSVLPAAYGIPDDGPVGELLAAADRGPMRPAHVHFMIDAPGHERLITHVFAAGDEHLASDAVFGVKETLIAPFERHDPGTAPDGRELDAEWFSMTYDFVLAPGTTGAARHERPRDRDRRPDRRQRPRGRRRGAVPRHPRHRATRDHQVPLDGEHPALAHHQPAHGGDPARRWHRGRHPRGGHAAAPDGRDGASARRSPARSWPGCTRGARTRARLAEYTMASPSTHCDLPQTLLEPILLGHAASRGARIRFDTEYLG